MESAGLCSSPRLTPCVCFSRSVAAPQVRGVVSARFLTHYSARPAVDCWVLTDRLVPTLRQCLRRYEEQVHACNQEMQNPSSSTQSY